MQDVWVCSVWVMQFTAYISGRMLIFNCDQYGQMSNEWKWNEHDQKHELTWKCTTCKKYSEIISESNKENITRNINEKLRKTNIIWYVMMKCFNMKWCEWVVHTEFFSYTSFVQPESMILDGRYRWGTSYLCVSSRLQPVLMISRTYESCGLFWWFFVAGRGKIIATIESIVEFSTTTNNFWCIMDVSLIVLQQLSPLN